MRVAIGIHKRDLDAAIEMYERTSQIWLKHATPTMFNAVTPQPQMSSCFLPSRTPLEDSIDGDASPGPPPPRPERASDAPPRRPLKTRRPSTWNLRLAKARGAKAKKRAAKAKKRAAKAEELLAEAEAAARECPLAAMACSPAAGPLPAVLEEALGVSRILRGASIQYGGTAADMDDLLARHPTRRFLFAGHADVDHFGRTRLTLGFTMPGGGLAPVPPTAIASLLGRHTPRGVAGRVLELAFLNGCKSKKLGMKTLLAGVDYVVCWSTLTHSSAAKFFSLRFFEGVERGYSYRNAFDYALAHLVAEPRPGGTTATLHGPQWVVRDPEPIPATLAYPIAAGIPVLLTPADRRDAARTLLAAAMWPRIALAAWTRRAKQRALVRAELMRKFHLPRELGRLIFQQP